MNQLIIWFIQLLHLCLILAVTIIPFTNSNYLLLLHSVIVPFIIIHWITNNDTCVLTTLEKYFKNTTTKADEDNCFTVRLISPVYNFKIRHQRWSFYIYTITIGMWLLSSMKLFLKYHRHQIVNFADLFEI